MANDLINHKVGLLVAGAVGLGYLLLRSKKEEKTGGLGTAGTKNLDLCGVGPHAWNDKQRAKVSKAILEEVDRVGRDWSGVAGLDEKAFEVVRAMTIRFCPKWPAPEALYQLPGFLESGPQAFRDWWEHVDIGVRRELGGWVT